MRGEPWTKERDAQLTELRERGLSFDQQSDAPVTLLDLQPHHCRWPIGEAPYTFCGGTALDGRSYCEHHHGVSIGR